MTHRLLPYLLVTLAVTACAPNGAPSGTEAPAQSQAAGDTVHVPLGQTRAARGGAVTITFLAALSDSRCPANVVCVWEGDAGVRLRVAIGGASRDGELHTRLEPRELRTDRYVLSLVGLLPYPGTPEYEANAAKVAIVQIATP